MRGQRVRFNENGDEVDENFWAQAAADQAAGRSGDDDGDDSKHFFFIVLCIVSDFHNLAANGGAIPFNTQFFHDDYDDGPGFDDVFEGDGDAGGTMPDVDAGEQDLLAATAGQSRRVRPEFVNYAKKAKRVDVRKLKENIWKGLDIKISKQEVDGDGDASMVSNLQHLYVSGYYIHIICRRGRMKMPLIHPRLGYSALSYLDCSRTTQKKRWKRSAQVSASSVCYILQTNRGLS